MVRKGPRGGHAATYFHRVHLAIARWILLYVHMCGIFGYYSYETPRTRREILETLLTGIRRQEYRGYDSAGIAMDEVPLEDDGTVPEAVPIGADWTAVHVAAGEPTPVETASIHVAPAAFPTSTLGASISPSVAPAASSHSLVSSGASPLAVTTSTGSFSGGVRVVTRRADSNAGSDAGSGAPTRPHSKGAALTAATAAADAAAPGLPRPATPTPGHADAGRRRQRAPCILKTSGKIADLTAHAYGALAAAQLPLETTFRTHAGIAHTRWATHGEPNAVNAHPVVCEPTADFCVVHNGIITNYAPLRGALARRGGKFVTETDTEVIPVLLQFLYGTLPGPLSFAELVVHALGELEGAFGLLVKSRHYPGSLVAARRGSPLLVGIRVPGDSKGKRGGEAAAADRGGGIAASLATTTVGAMAASPPRSPTLAPRPHPAAVELFFASDAAALVEHTKRVVVLEDGDVVHAWDGGYDIFDARADPSALDEDEEDGEDDEGTAGAIDGIHAGRPAAAGARAGRRHPPSRVARELQTLEMEVGAIVKGDYDTFMRKEIHEQPDSVTATMRGRVRLGPLPDGVDPYTTPRVKLGGLADYAESIMRSRRLVLIACGTSYHACLAVRPTFERLLGLPIAPELASDFVDRDAPVSRQDTCVFVSQSGETADTLRALEHAKSHGALCVGITNTVASSIARVTDAGVHINAGTEIGVASTKAYTSQIVALTLLALALGGDSVARQGARDEVLRGLGALPAAIRGALALEPEIRDLARELEADRSLLVFGRGVNYATALEAALKIKEVALTHAEGLLAGEMKHGPLALVDETLPVLVIATGDEMRGKMLSVVEQLLARKARIYVLADEGDERITQLCEGRARFFSVPHVPGSLAPVVNIVPLQLLAYHLARLRGLDVDQPRNLAKSVTVSEDDPRDQKRRATGSGSGLY